MNQIETKLPSFNERLSMFERRATIGNQTIQNRPKKINYAINKINVNEKIEKAVADQKQKTLENSCNRKKINQYEVFCLSLNIATFQ